MSAPLPLRVYVAHPIRTYGTAYAARRLEEVASLVGQLPGVEVVDPEQAGWESDAEWRSAWPVLLHTLTAVVVFGDASGAIGLGCVRELSDAREAGLPIAALRKGGRNRAPALVRLVDLDWLQRVPVDLGRVARLVTGERLGPDALGVGRHLP